jgi:hypothetical protein
MLRPFEPIKCGPFSVKGNHAIATRAVESRKNKEEKKSLEADNVNDVIVIDIAQYRAWGLLEAIHDTMSMMSSSDSVAISNSNSRPQLVLNSSSNSQSTMDYDRGVLRSMCSPFFPQLRKQLGPFLVDKTKLIEMIVHNSLNGNVDLDSCSPTQTLRQIHYAANAEVTTLAYFHALY